MSTTQVNKSFYDKVEHLLTEQVQLTEFYEAVNDALVRKTDLPTILQNCAEILVEHTGAVFGRIWTLDDTNNILELRASAGIYTRLDGNYSRIPVGKLKIGLIASERTAHLTNEVLTDPRISDQDWARREGINSFAGYPLIVEDRLVGVMCVFSREALSDLTLRTMASVANAIANGIERKQTDQSRIDVLEKLEEARDSERRRLSRQLHDEVAQQLVIASIKLSRIETKLVDMYPENNSLIADIVAAQELILRNHQSLRQMAHVLHSGILEHFGLPAALRKFISDVAALSTDGHTPIELEVSDNFPRLRPIIEVGIFRIVQEAVTNALKHARASNILLRLSTKRDERSISVMVRDDGCGFNSRALPGDGIGFASMRERADIIGAELNIKSVLLRGTEITLELTHEPDAV
ncbi:MAG: GAF domain-containing protein [Acidobacteriota bacterium]